MRKPNIIAKGCELIFRFFLQQRSRQAILLQEGSDFFRLRTYYLTSDQLNIFQYTCFLSWAIHFA